MKKFVSIISYIISILFLLVYIFLELNYNITLSEFGRLFLLCGSCIFLFIGGFIWSKYKKNNKAMKVNLWIFFILYLILIITLTLFDPMWGRRGFNSFDWTKDVFTHYIKNNLNIVPFTTIISYVKKFNSLYSTGSIMFNLFGNFIAFMPMAFFLPLLFEKQNKFKSFLLSIITIVIGIELTQFLTFTGRCDIDDLILNVSGALVLFKILKIKSVNSIIRNIFLLENNKVEKKSITKISVIILFIIISFISLVKFRNHLYNNKLQEHNNKYNFKIVLQDESESCDNVLEKFYEDEHYNYYFNCTKSDKVYAVINDKDKYLVKDLLNNNPTDYHITIDTFVDAGLDLKKESKYEQIVIGGKGNVSHSVKIKDDSILKIDSGDCIIDESKNSITFNIKFFIIPIKPGNTEVEIKFLDEETKKVNLIKRYMIDVKNNLDVHYEEIH